MHRNKLLCIVLVSLLFGCLKMNDSQQQPSDGKSLANTAVKWIVDQKKLYTEGSSFIDTLLSKAQWDQVSLTSINANEYLLYVPVLYNSQKPALLLYLIRPIRLRTGI